MSIWNKILIGLIIVAALAFFYLGLRTLKTHQHWQEAAAKHELKIKEYKQKTELLIHGTAEKPGIRQISVDLARVLCDRGRVWHNCEAKVSNVAKDTGTAEVHITLDPDNSNSAAMKENAKLYAFTEAETKDQGCYLGEFTVASSEDKEATLKPVSKMTTREIARLTSAKGPWVLCDQMPHDHHEVFAGLSEEDKKAILPPEAVLEYLKDGTSAEASDPKEHVVDDKYVRPLRDYLHLFNTNRTNWIDMVDLYEATNRDKAMIESALAEAKTQEANLQKQVAENKKKLEKYEAERDLVAAHQKALENKIETLTKRVAEVIETNKTMATQIARNQWDAVHRIDERTRAMAPSEAKGL
jgi:hypothetical protein